MITWKGSGDPPPTTRTFSYGRIGVRPIGKRATVVFITSGKHMIWSWHTLSSKSVFGASFVFCTALALTGCGQKQTESLTNAADPSATAEAQPASVAGAEGGVTTNEPGSVAHGLGKALQDSPFAAADPALKETYARALIAFDIGDYGRAYAELKDLAAGWELDQAQLKAVKELLGKALAAAPELATNNPAADPGANMAPNAFALAEANQPPFSTADPAVRETYARAKAAFDIGDYATASAELQDLVTNAQLNWQQKYAAQSLLDKTPRPVPGTRR